MLGFNGRKRITMTFPTQTLDDVDAALEPGEDTETFLARAVFNELNRRRAMDLGNGPLKHVSAVFRLDRDGTAFYEARFNGNGRGMFEERGKTRDIETAVSILVERAEQNDMDVVVMEGPLPDLGEGTGTVEDICRTYCRLGGILAPLADGPLDGKEAQLLRALAFAADVRNDIRETVGMVF